MKPNFKQMTLDELKAYIKNNRTDEDALLELYSRKHPKKSSGTQS